MKHMPGKSKGNLGGGRLLRKLPASSEGVSQMYDFGLPTSQLYSYIRIYYKYTLLINLTTFQHHQLTREIIIYPAQDAFSQTN